MKEDGIDLDSSENGSRYSIEVSCGSEEEEEEEDEDEDDVKIEGGGGEGGGTDATGVRVDAESNDHLLSGM